MERHFIFLFLMCVEFCFHVAENYFPEGGRIFKNSKPLNKKKNAGMELNVLGHNF